MKLLRYLAPVVLFWSILLSLMVWSVIASHKADQKTCISFCLDNDIADKHPDSQLVNKLLKNHYRNRGQKQ
jgi:hypothetical protein